MARPAINSSILKNSVAPNSVSHKLSLCVEDTDVGGYGRKELYIETCDVGEYSDWSGCRSETVQELHGYANMEVTRNFCGETGKSYMWVFLGGQPGTPC